jgi:uncharacterized protein (TIGR02466 family)|tara:strand:- start:1222 stop:1893 length:672 start_codon:yes stop_codon:yes gene_type:complete
MFVSGDIMDFIYPFQPPALLHDEIDKILLDKTNKMCDELLPDKEALEATSQLLDTIYHGFATNVTKPFLELKEQIFNVAYNYIKAFEKSSTSIILNDDHRLAISKMWFLELSDKDYLQAHHHGANNILSGVLYLKTTNDENHDTEFPKNWKRKGKTPYANGCIEFIYNPMILHDKLISSSTYLIRPEEGHLYIWPAWLFHTVYPYYGPGERRSLSFNVAIVPA